MQRWENKVASLEETRGKWVWSEDVPDFTPAGEVLNRLGAQGWELVAATVESSPSDDDRSGCTTGYNYTLKRPIHS
jgi:hypothetical protein